MEPYPLWAYFIKTCMEELSYSENTLHIKILQGIPLVHLNHNIMCPSFYSRSPFIAFSSFIFDFDLLSASLNTGSAIHD